MIKKDEYENEIIAKALAASLTSQVGVMWWYINDPDNDKEHRCCTTLADDILKGVEYAQNKDNFKGWPASLINYMY